MCMPQANQTAQRKQVDPFTQSLVYQLFWALFLIIAPIGYYMLPPLEDPSLGITIGAWCQLLGALIYWVVPRNGVRGDSADFALLLMISLCLRLSMTCKFQGYLPGDETGDGPYQVIEALTVLAALRGLVRTGLKPHQACTTALFLMIGGAAGYQCYGYMNRRAYADRIYAISVFTESIAWLLLARSIIMAGKKRDIFDSFLVPMIPQGFVRAHFWYLALDEIRPPSEKSIQFMDKFPVALIVVHVAMGVIATLIALYVVTLGRDNTKTAPQQVAMAAPQQQVAMAAPLLAAPAVMPTANSNVVPSIAGLASLPAPAGSGCKCFAPVSATYENGVLQVQYNPVY